MLDQNATLRNIFAENNIGPINSYPETIQILPSHKCNYRCKMCFLDKEKLKNGKEIDFASLQKLEPVLPFVEDVYLTGGEPLLYSRFDDLAAMLGAHGCPVRISTNGSLIGECFDSIVKHVRTLKVSIDAATQETYKKIRIRGDFDTVIKGLLEIAKWKIQNKSAFPRLEFSFVSMYSNVHELPALVTLASQLGIEKIDAQHMGNKKGKEHLKKETLFNHKDYSDQYFIQAMDAANKLGINFSCRGLFDQKKQEGHNAKFTKTKKCTEPWRYMVIRPDGDVFPCCPCPRIVGNINDQTIDEIWNGEGYRYFRERVNTDSEPPECSRCSHCKIDLGNKDIFLGA